MREGIRKLLELDGDVEVVGEAKEGREAVALAKKLRPDVVLMDIAMPRLNGLEATRQVLRELPTAKVLILSAHNDDAYIESATKCGAVGFLLKQTSAQDLCRRHPTKSEGGRPFSAPFSPSALTVTVCQPVPAPASSRRKLPN